MALLWDNDFSVGDATIDDQHRQLFAVANRLEEAIDQDSVGSVLEDLLDYARYHFDFEEKVLENVGYRRLRDHRKIHLEFINQLSGFVNDFLEGRFTQSELSIFLSEWIKNHILGEDIQYRSIIQSSGYE